MMQGREPSQESTEADEEQFSPEEEPTTPRKKKSKNNKRRFSDEQVKSLETIFESETKLEPRKKVQVARDLGLQPRQVAIWFQNKRARWKSKQIEKNYRILKANYDNLKARFDSIKKEKESLLEQVCSFLCPCFLCLAIFSGSAWNNLSSNPWWRQGCIHVDLPKPRLLSTKMMSRSAVNSCRNCEVS